MSFSATGGYSGNHKVWDHNGIVIPTVNYSEGVSPAGEFKPAAWLPVQFWDKHFENWYVVMPGKLVAEDNQGRIVPAQYGLAGATVTYTANDYEAGTIDVRTGTAYATNGTTTFNVAAVSDFMGTGVAMAVSYPIGVAQYAYLKWAGDGGEYDDGTNPVGYVQHNFNMQHRVAVLCDSVLELPIVPAERSTEVALTQDSRTSNVAKLTGTFTGLLPIAKNTVRTAITFEEGAGVPGDVASRFANEVASAALVTQSGDWYMDPATGDVYVYASADIGATDYEVNFFHYGSAPTGANVSKFACVLGNFTGGEFLQCNVDSNFVVADPTSDNVGEIVAQVLQVEDMYDKSSLSLVKTGYSSLSTSATGALPGYAGQLDQMPGSANGGVPAKVHYAGAANLVARVNLIRF